MKGRLIDQPLAELIREIATKGLSGTLRLEQDRAQVAVYFEDGPVVFAASNVRALRLREYLTKRGLVSEKELASLGDNLSDLGLAAALSANGSLRQEDINAVLATLVNDTLRVALLWTEGSWEFNERARLDGPVRVRVDTSKLLREAAHRLPLKFVSLRFRNPGETVSRAPDVSGSGDFLPNESFMLSRLDAPINVEELISVSGLREFDAYRILYGLTLSGLVTREYWHNAFRTAPAAPSKAQTTARVSPLSPVAESGAADNRWSSINEENDLQLFFDRLTQATNYYQVLDLPLAAEATEIKDAYYALARRYHPDRFHLRSGTALHTRISSAFARITQAYETLTDPEARSTYDHSLQRSKEFADSAPTAAYNSGPGRGTPDRVVGNSVSGPSEDLESEGGSDSGKSEHSFKEGLGALKQGQINAAVAHLARASRLAPHEARYRAYYGRALAASEKTRRLAETEIQAAVALEPGNANYRTMLAELYFDLKFHRRAQTELDRALALDPNNTTAHSLLRKLESSGKGR
jgi:curved DNA-binding protein CbpA